VEKIEFLKGLYEASAEGVIIVDARATILWTNKTVRDFTRAEIEGQNALTLLNQEAKWPPVTDQSVRRTFQGVTIEYIITPLPDSSDYIISVRNLDDANGIKKEMKVKMEAEIEKIMGQFVHDLFTPLTAVMGFLQIIEEDMESEDPKKEFVEAALKAANKLLKSRNNFLALSRIAKGDHRIKREKLNLFKIIQENKKNFEASNSFKISQRPIIGAQFEIMADNDLLDIAIGNALKNAAEAMHEQKILDEKIIINFGKIDEMVIISIVNPGEIPEEVREKLFKENFTTKANGNGLGARAIGLVAKAHDGNVVVNRLEDAVEIKITFPG